MLTRNNSKLFVLFTLIVAHMLFGGGSANAVYGLQDAEGTGATIFAPGVISTGKDMAITFSPDSSVIYFVRRLEKLEKDPGKTGSIFWSERIGDGWSKPVMTPYSGVYSTVDPAISPDGSKMYIMTTRPSEGEQAQKEPDIWMLTRNGQGWTPESWGEPIHIGPSVNSKESREGAPTLSLRGNLYFFSDRKGGKGATDIYVSKYEYGVHLGAKNLGSAINSESWEGHPFIAKDESVLLFTSEREDGFGACDLYISFSQNGRWSPARNLGPEVNTNDCEMLGVISPDGKQLFFTRTKRGGPSNIYRIDIQDLEIFQNGS